MAPRKRKAVRKRNADGAVEAADESGDGTYQGPRPRGPRSGAAVAAAAAAAAAPSGPSATYSLRNHSEINPPDRYSGDTTRAMGSTRATGSTRPLWVHPQPAFNEELAKIVPWNTLPPDHKGPIPSEVAYAEVVAERERKREQNINADHEPANQADEIVVRSIYKDGETPTGPTVAHLSRKSPPKNPMAYLYTADPSIVDNTKFHPPSDQYSYRNEYHPEFSLDIPDENTTEELREIERRIDTCVVSSSPPYPSLFYSLHFCQIQ